jgi:hypothetical protein
MSTFFLFFKVSSWWVSRKHFFFWGVYRRWSFISAIAILSKVGLGWIALSQEVTFKALRMLESVIALCHLSARLGSSIGTATFCWGE